MTEAAMSTEIPITHSRLAASSAKSLKSSGGFFATLWVARCSMTSDAPNVIAPAIAISTAISSFTRARCLRVRSGELPHARDRWCTALSGPQDSRPGQGLADRHPVEGPPSGAYPIDAASIHRSGGWPPTLLCAEMASLTAVSRHCVLLGPIRPEWHTLRGGRVWRVVGGVFGAGDAWPGGAERVRGPGGARREGRGADSG